MGKPVEKPENYAIMKLSEASEVMRMMVIGKIDREIYRCITEDIVTEDVVLTEKQLQHILDRHPDVFQKVLDNLAGAICDPDYILADRHIHTGLIIKEIDVDGNSLQFVLRICTSQDEPGYKNSVISCWEISEQRLQNYLRNKTVLYKRKVDKYE
jgi:hypothetical protein